MRNTFERERERENLRSRANLNAVYPGGYYYFSVREPAGFAWRERRRAAKYELARQIEKKELQRELYRRGERAARGGRQRETAL